MLLPLLRSSLPLGLTWGGVEWSRLGWLGISSNCVGRATSGGPGVGLDVVWGWTWSEHGVAEIRGADELACPEKPRVNAPLGQPHYNAQGRCRGAHPGTGSPTT